MIVSIPRAVAVDALLDRFLREQSEKYGCEIEVLDSNEFGEILIRESNLDTRMVAYQTSSEWKLTEEVDEHSWAFIRVFGLAKWAIREIGDAAYKKNIARIRFMNQYLVDMNRAPWIL